MDVLSIKNLKKSFGGLEVLKGISMAVSEVVSRRGQSGRPLRQIDASACATLLEKMDGGELALSWRAGGVDGRRGARLVYAAHSQLKRMRGMFGLFSELNLFPTIQF
jgi:polar amino acid transport system ATP-binding protein